MNKTLSFVFLGFLVAGPVLAHAGIEVRYVQVITRSLELELTAEGNYRVTNEVAENLEASRILSGSTPVKLNRPSSSVSIEKLDSKNERWQVKDGHLVAVLEGRRWVSAEAYGEMLAEDTSNILAHSLYELVTEELPYMDLLAESPKTRVGRLFTSCRERQPGRLTCTQSLEGEIVLETKKYESFRKLGIDPVSILKRASIQI